MRTWTAMRRLSWQVYLGVTLLALSAIVYGIQYLIFRDARSIFYYIFQDFAFVFVEVLLVTLIIHALLREREKSQRLEKLNMVIGAFFSEVGTGLLTYLSDFDPSLDVIRGHLMVSGSWSDKEFSDVAGRLKVYDYNVDMSRVDLSHLRTFLLEKREFLLRMVQNPNLLEHESFTGLLRAVFHLTEELAQREDVSCLSKGDCHHLDGDVKRVYTHLALQWLTYMKYLKANYPYLFSLAIRTNPFDQTASVTIR
jgi:hypothetical protein